MKLQTKVKILWWAITAVFALPALILAFLALISYHIPPKKIFRDGVGEAILTLVAAMSEWRYEVVAEFYRNRK